MPKKLDAENLKALSNNELIGLWEKTFRSSPPESLHRSYLIKYIDWQNKYGGLPHQTQKKIDKMVNQYEKTKQIDGELKNKSSSLIINIGTKLIREFKGQKYEIVAVEKGFEYKGERYKSLSAIANKITGTQWNGKVFFGVAK